MSFCSKCGTKLESVDKFCPKCGGKQSVEEKPKVEKKPESRTPEKPAEITPTTTTQNSNQGGGKTNWGLTCGCLGCGGIVLIVLIIAIIFGLGVMGAKGQPGTIIKPTTIKTAQNLAATGQNNAINLAWKKSDSATVTKYNVYKSTKFGGDFQKLQTLETIANLTYSDTAVEKGVTYYYVVTAVAGDGVESGNSNQASYALESAPILPNGVQSWQDVLTKYDSDSKYAALFGEVTGLKRTDIEKYIILQNQGKTLKKKLPKGSIIINTTENYKILNNYTLPEDKWFLTDENGNTQIMIYCGNPMKLIKKFTAGAKFVNSVQNITYNIIYILPVQVTTTIIYAADSLNGFVDIVIPDDSWGPGYEQDHPQDNPASPTSTSQTIPASTPTTTLTSGQQWAVEGKVLVEATPHDPAPGESVNITVTLNPAESGIEISYSVSGTDGYTDSGTTATDASGQIQFSIPGGADGIVDVISVRVPVKSLEGSTSYTF